MKNKKPNGIPNCAVPRFVFGAGASYDSVPHLPAPPPGYVDQYQAERPPLANQLFDTRPIFVDLMEKFKDCQPVVPLLRQAGVSIEKKLAEFRGQTETFPQMRRVLASIEYYLHFAVWDCQDKWRSRHQGITNFATLLLEIERWLQEKNEKVCFVTFNYDTMLEEAVFRFGLLQTRRITNVLARIPPTGNQTQGELFHTATTFPQKWHPNQSNAG